MSPVTKVLWKRGRYEPRFECVVFVTGHEYTDVSVYTDVTADKRPYSSEWTMPHGGVRLASTFSSTREG